MDALTLHRFQFAFTVTYHYLFPQFTMGLSLLIFILKTMALKGSPEANDAVRFWSKILGVTFVMGVVTGIPLEFQFGTNWSRFSQTAGEVIGQTLAMEGVFAFFLESSFLYLLIYGEKWLKPSLHWTSSLLVWIGTWLSGFFIVCTNAWMQNPVGYQLTAEGKIQLESLRAVLLHPYAWVQYAHTMTGAVITGSFAMASVGAFYLLRQDHTAVTKKFVTLSVISGFIACIIAVFPTGDLRARLLVQHQPVTFAAMEGIFETEKGAGLIMIGQPNVETRTLDNPLILPKLLSFLTHQRWNAEIKGLNEFDPSLYPDNIPLLYYTYRIMAGLGTFFILIMTLSAVFLWRRQLFGTRWLLWILMLSFPFPFIANIAGWLTTELGRQPWIIYGILRTAESHSAHVSAGNILFTLIGFMGMYTLLSLLYFFLMTRLIAQGPVTEERSA